MSDIFKYNKIALKQLGFKLLRSYELYDETSEQLIGTIKENFSYNTIISFIPYLTDFKGFDLMLFDSQGNKVQQYKRAAGINPLVMVYNGEGELVCKYKPKFFTMKPKIEILDSQDNQVAYLIGKIIGRQAEVYSNDDQLICTIYSPLLAFEELKLKYQQIYHIQFMDTDTEPLLKQQIFGLFPALDGVYFEN